MPVMTSIPRKHPESYLPALVIPEGKKYTGICRTHSERLEAQGLGQKEKNDRHFSSLGKWDILYHLPHKESYPFLLTYILNCYAYQ
jgi:hypothetical protein